MMRTLLTNPSSSPLLFTSPCSPSAGLFRSFSSPSPPWRLRRGLSGVSCKVEGRRGRGRRGRGRRTGEEDGRDGGRQPERQTREQEEERDRMEKGGGGGWGRMQEGWEIRQLSWKRGGGWRGEQRDVKPLPRNKGSKTVVQSLTTCGQQSKAGSMRFSSFTISLIGRDTDAPKYVRLLSRKGTTNTPRILVRGA